MDELAYREGEKHDEIVERIKEARGFGDLSENSEYDAAKEEEARNASRINEIRQILSIATVVEAGSGELTVSIGTTVELEDEKGAKTSFTIVGTTETNSLEHKISNESPVAPPSWATRRATRSRSSRRPAGAGATPSRPSAASVS